MLFFELFPAFLAIVSLVIVVRLVAADREARRQVRLKPDTTNDGAGVDGPPAA